MLAVAVHGFLPNLGASLHSLSRDLIRDLKIIDSYKYKVFK